MDKAVGCTQADLIEDDIEILERALQVAADHGRLPKDVLEGVAINVQAPNAITRNRIQDAQADEIYIRNGALSTETMSERGGFDPEIELPRIKANPPPALVAAEMAGQPAGSGDTRSHQAPQHGQKGGRGVPAGREPGPGTSIQKAEESITETAHDSYSQDLPTQAELEMSAVLLTPEWLAQTKAEILALPQTANPINPDTVGTEYEPGVKGILLGTVDNQQVYAVDMRAMEIKHRCPGLIVAGNHMKWDFVPPDKVVVDFAFTAADRAADLLHEIGETRLMAVGKWPYALAHRTINAYETAFLLELRPELAALKPA